MSNQVVNAYRFAGGGLKEATGDGMFCGGATPSYINDASVASNYVWSTSTGMASARGYCVGIGYKSSFLIVGGWEGAIVDNSQYWNGSSWIAEVTLNTERRDTGSIAGSASACIVASGRNGAGAFLSTTASWNGSSWASAGSIATPAVEFSGGDGNTSDMLYTAGANSSGANQTGTGLYNGSIWSSGVSLPNATASPNLAGSSSSAIHSAGGDYASSWSFDGSSWTAETAYSESGDTTTRYGAGGGVSDSHWFMCGLAGSSGNTACGNWNGSAWVSKGAMTIACYAGGGDGSV